MGTVIARGLGLVSAILVARMLGKSGFGELGIIQSTVGLFSVFAGLGLGLTATKFVAEFREKDPPKAGRIIAFSTWIAILSGAILTLLFIFAAPWLSANTLAAPHLVGLLRLSALLIAFGALNGTQTGALAGFEAFRTIARVNLWSGLATFPLMVMGTAFAGLQGAVWGLVGGLVVNCILNRFALQREMDRAGIRSSLVGAREELPLLWRFSFPALLGSMLVGPVTWLCYAMLVNQPGGYAEMGVFNAANQWFTLLMFLPGVLQQASLPMLSERIGQGDLDRATRILFASIKVSIGVVFPLVVVGSIASPLIMSLYGTGFNEDWLTLVIVLATAGILAVQSPIGVFLQASERMWLATATSLAWAVTFLIASYALTPIGALGLAVARAIAYGVNGILIVGIAYYVVRQSKSIQDNKAVELISN